ncbi:MAG: hypothetical protein L6R28_10630 [Planctomycetes bacterium]|nr:hypothetical protein [Planctomycetota bacterium]
MDMDAEIPRWVRRTLLAVVLLGCATVVLGSLYAVWEARVPDRVAKAPDGRREIVLRELTGAFRIDRNFILYIRDLEGGGAEKEIFRSPDEGRPIGTERFYWPTDSAYVLLAGKHFTRVGSSDMKLEDGVDPYLLYRVDDGKIWLGYLRGAGESISREQLLKINFVADFRLKKGGGE